MSVVVDAGPPARRSDGSVVASKLHKLALCGRRARRPAALDAMLDGSFFEPIDMAEDGAFMRAAVARVTEACWGQWDRESCPGEGLSVPPRQPHQPSQ